MGRQDVIEARSKMVKSLMGTQDSSEEREDESTTQSAPESEGDSE